MIVSGPWGAIKGDTAFEDDPLFKGDTMSDPATDDPNPIIPVWAECSECNTAYILQRCYSMSKGWMWLWTANCKCGKRRNPAPPVLRNEEGVLP